MLAVAHASTMAFSAPALSAPRARAGAVSMIKFDLKTGVMEGAADPRRPGLALGA